MLVVHVTVVQIVGVPFVLNRGMAAIGTMGMVTVVAVIVSFAIVSHGLLLLLFCASAVMRLRQRVEKNEANEVPACA